MNPNISVKRRNSSLLRECHARGQFWDRLPCGHDPHLPSRCQRSFKLTPRR